MTNTIPDHAPVDPDAIIVMLTRLADGTICVHCGRSRAIFVQIGRSYVAHPCGHRKIAKKIAKKWGLS
jgi:hypothetical protein